MSHIRAKNLVWDWFDEGTDHATVSIRPAGWQVSGQHGPSRYWLGTDASGVTNSVSVAVVADSKTPELALHRDTTGWHWPDGTLVPDSAAALDPDIACTALTNTLPIRRLGLGVGETAEIDVLYIPVPSLVPGVVRQRYNRTEQGYLYENLHSGFRAQLAVDSDGWVTDYPGVCRLKEPPR